MNIISNNSRNFISLNKLLDRVHYTLLDEINDKLQVSNSFFKLKNHDINLFNFIGESDIVIATPYSSPVLLAQILKIPAFYYDPDNQLAFPKKYFPKSIVKVSKLENLIKEIRGKLPL